MILQSRAKLRAKNTVPAVLLLIVLALFLVAVSKIAGKSENEGARLAEQGLRRAAVQCYALEGVYPPDLEYLKEHYGMRPDEGKYIVYYTYMASNLMPEIDVILASAADLPGSAGGAENAGATPPND